MTFKLSKKNPLLWLYIGGALLLLLAVVLWCVKVSVSPERVFWGTIQNSLSSHGVTIHSEQSNGNISSDQTIRFSLGPDNLSHSMTTLSQAGTTVVNEMVGTPTIDYTRYLDIKTDQKRADGSDMDFSGLLGIWAKGAMGGGQFFTQAVLGASLPIGGMGVPVANLQPELRDKLMQQIQGDMVYQIDFSKVKKERSNGRLLYTYEATIQPIAYVTMMKQFSSSLGLHGLDQLEPENYRGQKPFKLQITVDARARQVVRITSAETGAKQTYSGWGIPVQIEVPKNAITGAELQKLLSDLQ